MSVMKCDRVDCDNIMCDRLILNGKQYICNSCYNELKDYKSKWPNSMSKSRVSALIKEFMGSPIGSGIILFGDEIDAEFERLIGRR